MLIYICRDLNTPPSLRWIRDGGAGVERHDSLSCRQEDPGTPGGSKDKDYKRFLLGILLYEEFKSGSVPGSFWIKKCAVTCNVGERAILRIARRKEADL